MKNRLFDLMRKRELELGRDVTQAEIAKTLEVSERLIGRWMRNEVTRFDADIVQRICKEFKCDAGDLLYIDERAS